MAKVKHKFTTGKKAKPSAPTPLPPDPEEEAARLLLQGIESTVPHSPRTDSTTIAAATATNTSDGSIVSHTRLPSDSVIRR